MNRNGAVMNTTNHIRPFFDRFNSRIRFEAENGSNAAGQTAANNDGGGHNNSGGGNNNENFLETNQNLWQDEPADNGTGGQNNSGGGDGNNKVSFDDFVNQKDFGFNLSDDEVQKMFDQRDVSGLKNAMTSSLRSAYKDIVLDVTKMIKGSTDKLRGEIDTTTKNRITATQMEESLYEALPFTKAPAVKPVAIAIKGRFLKMGKSDEEANKMVKQFFAETSKVAAEDLDITVAPKGAPGSNGMNRGSHYNQRADAINWAEILGGGSKEEN